jgi:serine/threonine protein kinase
MANRINEGMVRVRKLCNALNELPPNSSPENIKEKEPLLDLLRRIYRKRRNALDVFFTKSNGIDYNFELTDNYSNFVLNASSGCMCSLENSSGKPVCCGPQCEVNYDSGDESASPVIQCLSQIGSGSIGSAYLVNVRGYPVIAKSIKDNDVNIALYIPLVIHPTENSEREIESVEHNYVLNSSYEKYIVSASADNFANQSLQNMIIEKIIESAKQEDPMVAKIFHQPSYVHQLDAFYCSCNGSKEYIVKDSAGNQKSESLGQDCTAWSLMDWAQLGSMTDYLEKRHQYSKTSNTPKEYEVTVDLVVKLIMDVLRPLIILKSARHGFVHSDMKATNIFLGSSDNITNTTPPEVRYHRDTNVYAMLADFDKSSIFYNNVRFHYSPGGIRYFRFMINREIMNPSNVERHYVPKDHTGYLATPLGKEAMAINSTAMYSPFPVPMSLDIYVFIVSLCFIKPVHKLMFKDRGNNLLKRMWVILFRDHNDKNDDILNNANQTMVKEYKQYREELKSLKNKLATLNDQAEKEKIKAKITSLTGMTTMARVISALPLRFDALDALCRAFMPREYETLVNYNNSKIILDQQNRKEIVLSKNIDGGGFGMGFGEHKHICRSFCDTSKTCPSNRYSTRSIGSIISGFFGFSASADVNSLASCTVPQY